MGVNKTVFGSRTERRNFQKLQTRWGERYDLWHNLPFLNIFTREPLIDPDSYDLRLMTISDLDWQRLKKTSVDFVLCQPENDKPLVCIDFDGLQEGFSAGREYRPGVENPSSWRTQITTLKLRVAHGSLFPYVVVGSRHFADLSPTIRLCIVDGIIGEVLAKNATSARFAQGVTSVDLGVTDAEWTKLSPWHQQELVQDFALSVEVENDYEYNPIYAEVAKLNMEMGDVRSSHRFVDAPGTVRTAEGRRLEEPRTWGAECVVETPDVGVIKRVIWLPNFNAPGFTGLGLAEQIAHLMALDEVRQRRSGSGPTL